MQFLQYLGAERLAPKPLIPGAFDDESALLDGKSQWCFQPFLTSDTNCAQGSEMSRGEFPLTSPVGNWALTACPRPHMSITALTHMLSERIGRTDFGTLPGSNP